MPPIKGFTALSLLACALMTLSGAAAADDAMAKKTGPVGSVVSVSKLKRSLWLPDARRALLIRYVTTDPFGRRALSTGTLTVPKGRAPKGGWPVISWAHGTSGLGDSCEPSQVGPALPERDRPYLNRWLEEGYAIAASDYVGLGTPGLMPYLDGRTTAHSIVDVVKAARKARRFPLARKWVVVGQSQGGGAAIYTARYASEFGGRKLDYRGAVGTGTPANVERVLLGIGPKVPPVQITPGINAYIAYIFTSLRYVHPELGIDEILTAEGREVLDIAETACVFDLEEVVDGAAIGDWFSRPAVTLPGFAETVRNYMGMPESGFDRPFFMGHGLLDTDVPYAITAPYVAALELNGEPVTFVTYPEDHSGALIASQADTVPFVRGLFE